MTVRASGLASPSWQARATKPVRPSAAARAIDEVRPPSACARCDQASPASLEPERPEKSGSGGWERRIGTILASFSR